MGLNLIAMAGWTNHQIIFNAKTSARGVKS